MLYLVQQIVFCLLFIAVIGVAIGWLLRGVGSSRHSDMVAAEWKARVAHLESKNATATATAPQPGPAAAPDVQTDALRRRLAEAERELATLRTARAVRTQADVQTAAVQIAQLHGEGFITLRTVVADNPHVDLL